MKNLRSGLRALVAIVFFIVATSAFAESRVDQVWTCTLNEGQSIDDAATAQAAWVAWANKQPHGGKIRGYVASPIVSSNLNIFHFIDSYPDLATLAADNKAYDSPAGEALQADFDTVATCSSAALFAVQDGK